MSLDINNWEEFVFGKLICSIAKAKALNKDDLQIATNAKSGIRYITRTGENNGCEFLAELSSVDSNFIQEGNAITIGDTTATCFYQSEKFITGDHMVVVRADWLNEILSLYIVTILNKEQYKYSYGRAFLMDRIKNTLIKLPILHNEDGTIHIDASKKYSDDGYVPDWKFMEDYIKSLHHKPLTTNNKKGQTPTLNVCDWKKFHIREISEVYTGGDLILSMVDEGEIPVASHKVENNGVGALVDYIDNRQLFDCDKTIALADRGCFHASVQTNDFYIGTRVKALKIKKEVSKEILIFIATIINQETFKYSYGRNCTAGVENVTIKLPVQHNTDGTIFIDNKHTYSEEGYVPDWQWMERYIKTLPYGDRL